MERVMQLRNPSSDVMKIDMDKPREVLARQYEHLGKGREQFLNHLKRDHFQSIGGSTCHPCLHLRHKILFIEGVIREIEADLVTKAERSPT